MQNSNIPLNATKTMQLPNQQPLQMQQQDPLVQLRDIHVPNEVSAWPLDWGWWLLIVLVVITIFGLYKTLSSYLRHNKPRKQALALLESVSAQQSNWPVTLNSILKRAAMSYYPAQQVAGLYGKQWQAFLTSALKKRDKKLESDLALLVSNIYHANPNSNDFDACKSAVKGWLSKARFPKNKLTFDVGNEEFEGSNTQAALNGASANNNQAKEPHHA